MTVKPGIIFLQRDSFQIYSPYLPTVMEFRFVPEIVRDLDVINKELLENLIKLFITNAKIPPSGMIIVVGDTAAFIKDFLPPAPPPPQPGQLPQPTPGITDELKVEAEKFADHVPFEQVVSKTFPWNNGLRVFAVNEELYESIKRSFEKNGFTIDTVIPGFLLGNTISANHALDVATASTLPDRIVALKQNNLLIRQEPQPLLKEKKEFDVEVEEPEHKATVEMGMPQGNDKKRLFVMVGVFAVLIIILIIVYFQSLTPPPVTQTNTTSQQLPAAVQQTQPTLPASQPTAVVTSVSPVHADPSTLTVQIITSPASAQSGQRLKTQLDSFGFKSVQIQNQTSTTAQSTITYSGNPSAQVRASVLAEVRQIAGEVTVQENKQSPVDISIVLAK